MPDIRLLYRTHQQKAFVLADQALMSGSNFITSLVYARLLGLESYGAFVLGWMIITFVSNLQQAFIFSPMANVDAGLSEQKKPVYWHDLFIINLLFTCCCTLLIMAFNYIAYTLFHVEYLMEMIYTLPMAAFAYLSFDFIRKLFLLQNRAQHILIFDAAYIAVLTLVLFSLHLSNNICIASIILAIATSYLLTICISLLVLRPVLSRLPLNIAIVQEHWRQGKWLLATTLLQWLSGNYFIIAAAGLLGTKEIGIIRIAQNIVGVLNILFIAMENYIPVSASKILKVHGEKGLFTYLKKLTIKGLAVTVVLCSSIILLSHPIIEYLYGIEYLPYEYVVQAFASFYILVFTAIPLRFAIKTLEHNHHIFIGYLISALFSLLCAKMLVKQYELQGVIIGIFLTQALTQIWYILSLKRYIYEYYSYSIRKS